jgi:hypothetical protein
MLKITRATSLIVSIFFFLNLVQASETCQYINGSGTQRCTLLVGGFNHNYTAYQENSQWCWAASISMVFKYYNYDVSQETIVKSIKKKLVNQPGYPKELNAALNRTWKDETEQLFASKTKKLFKSWKAILKDIKKNRPVIIGAVGHATVVIGATFLKASNGRTQFESVIVSDPWPTNGGIRYLNNNEIKNLQYVARITVESRDGEPPEEEKYIKKPKTWLKEKAGMRRVLSSLRMKCEKSKTTLGKSIYRVNCQDKKSTLSCVAFFEKIKRRKYVLYYEGPLEQGYRCDN